MKRKILSILLTLSMMLTLLPVTALAEEPAPETQVTEEAAASHETEAPAEADVPVEQAEVQNEIQPTKEPKAESVLVIISPDGTTEEKPGILGARGAVDGSTVKLLKDITSSGDVFFGEQNAHITLDLNGKTLNAGVTVDNGRSLTVKDSSATSAPVVSGNHQVTYETGKIVNSETAVVVSGKTSMFTLESGMIESLKGPAGVSAIQGGIANINGGYILSQEFGVLVHDAGSTANINGGVIETKDNVAVGGNGSPEKGGTVINISGGKLIGHIKSSGYIACGVYHPQEGLLNITGGEIYADGGVGVLMRAGQMNMTGGTITATGTASGKVGDSKIVANCYGIQLDYESNYPGNKDLSMSAQISGTSTVEAASGVDALNVLKTGAQAPAKTIEVAGGTFSSDPSAYLSADLVVQKQGADYVVGTLDNLAVAQIGENKYTTLGAAVAAAKSGDTIKVLKTIDDLDPISITGGKKVNLDLNSFDLNFKAAKAFIVNNGTLNLVGNGTITAKYVDAYNSALDLTGSNDDVADYSVVTIGEGVTVKSDGSFGGAIFSAKDEKGKATGKAYGAKLIVNGRFESTYGFSINGLVTETTGKNLPEVVVNPTGVITGSSAIYGAGYGNYIIKGTLEGNGEFGIEVRAGNLTVEDGAKITCSADFSDPAPNGNGSTVCGAAIAVSQHTTNLPINVKIMGGTITETGKNGHALYEIDTVKGEAADQVAKDVSITVTGGEFNGKIHSTNKNLTISGGTFAQDVDNAYIAADAAKATVTAADGTVKYAVGQKDIQNAVIAAGSNAQVDVTKGDVALTNVPQDTTVKNSGSGTVTADGKNVSSGSTITPNPKPSHGGGGGSSHSGDYQVIVDDSKNGSVRVNTKWADKGDTVTVTVKPDKGYELDELIVTDKNGDELRVKAKGDDKYTFTMPASKVTVEAFFTEIKAEKLPFVDVPQDAYYYDAVDWAVDNKITSGVTSVTFQPYASCTRAQTVTFLWRAAGCPAPVNTVNPFTDVSADMYYYDAVLWAVERGITMGTTATTFSPDATVTRGQTVTFLHRYAGTPAAETTTTFTDVASGSYCEGAVQWAVENGITNGTTNVTFGPADVCTRGQIVTFLYRFAK